MTIEGLEGIIDAFHPAIHEARGYVQQTEVAARNNRNITASAKSNVLIGLNVKILLIIKIFLNKKIYLFKN